MTEIKVVVQLTIKQNSFGGLDIEEKLISSQGKMTEKFKELVYDDLSIDLDDIK